jgi:hypothetical protein
VTTITYRNGVMASDSGCWIGDAAHQWTRKLARGPDGVLFGVSGNAGKAASFLAWVDSGYAGEMPHPARDGDHDDFVVLRADPGGALRLLCSGGLETMPGAPYFAIGSGSPTAFGALWAGASAEDAVRAVVEHGHGARGRVQTITHEG